MKRLAILSAMCMLLLSALAPAAAAATYTWDANTATTGAQDGSGTWNLTSLNWWNGSADQAWPGGITSTTTAVFGNGGTAGTVTVSGTVGVGGITFSAVASGAYTITGGTIDLNGSTVTITTNAAAATIGSTLSGTAGLTTLGSGTLTLSGSNTYAGGTSVAGGTLTLANRLALQDSTLDYNNYGGSLSFGTLASATFGGLQGEQNLSLTNAATATAAVALSVGNNGASTTYSGAFTGSGGLTKLGTGMLILTGTNTYTGGTTLSAGELSIAGDSNIGGSTSGINFSGGILQVTGTALTSIGGGHTVNWSSFNGGFDINSANNTFTVSQTIGGTGGLTKLGPGTLALSGTSSYIGGTTVNGGTFAVTGSVQGVPGELGADQFVADTGGSVSLSGVGLLVTSNQYIGYSGTGSFTQSGGANDVNGTGNLYFGYNAGSIGNYTLSGSGRLYSSNLYVGNSGSGNFVQSSGTNSVSYWLYLGYNTSATGTYLLDGPGLLSAPYESVGGQGSSITQSAGTNSVNSYLYLGVSSVGSGTYTLGGSGRLSAGTENVGPTGSFIQSGGTNTVASTLYLGFNSGSNGTYTLGGNGQLSAAYEYIGYNPAASPLFEQTGGTNSVSTLFSIGTGARYQCSGGTLQVSGGMSNHGTFDGGSGPGTLSLRGAIADFSTGSLVNVGSMSLLVDASSLLIVPPGFNPASVFGSVSNSGIIHPLGTTLAVAAGQQVVGSVSINDFVSCQGTITAGGTNGAISLNGGLNLSGTGTVALGGGSLTTDNTASTIMSGSLSTSSQYVGYSGTGSFVQSGGTNYVADLYLGYNVGSTGAFTLSGSGKLYPSDNQYVGYSGVGNFVQSSGTVKASGEFLCLGYNAASSGTYTLSGSASLCSNNLYVGNSGSGNFVQSGGTNTNTNLLFLGYLSGSSGTYTLNGSAQLSAYSQDIGYWGTGSFTQSGGTNSIGPGAVTLGEMSGSSGTYTLSGGTLTALQVSGGGGTGIFNFNGGTLQAFTGAGNPFMSGLTNAYIKSGGANVDTNGQNPWITQPLLHDPGLGSTADSGLAKCGAGTLTLSGSNTYTGNTSITGGTLALGNGLALQSSTLDYNNYGGGLSFGTLTSATFGGLQGSQNLALTNAATAPAAVALSVGNNGASTTYSGALSGTGSVTKIGSGTLALTGASTYSGGTTVSAGVLQIGAGGGLGNTAISVTSGGSFAPQPGAGSVAAGTTGAGSAGASLSLASGAVFDMTDGAVGTFNLSQQSGFAGTALTLGGATLKFDLGASGADSLVVNQGAAAVSGTNTISINGLGPGLTPGGNYTLVSAPSGLAGTFLFPNSATSEAVTVGGAPYQLTLANSATAETVHVYGAASYQLTATAAATAIICGGSTTVTSTIQNTGTQNANVPLDYTGLSVSASGGGSVSGLSQSGSGLVPATSGSGTATFTGNVPGVAILTPTVGTATNTLIGGAAGGGAATAATVTVLDHSAAAFSTGGTTLTLDFGTVLAGSNPSALLYQIQNQYAPYRAALDLDQVVTVLNPSNKFSTTAALFSNLPSGNSSSPFTMAIDTSTTGQFTGQFQFELSDEKDLSGHAGAQVLTINVDGTISLNTTTAGGGPGTVGGMQATFGQVLSPGTLSNNYSTPTMDELQQDIGATAAGAMNFVLPGNQVQLWDVGFSGTFAGTADLVFHYDPTLIGTASESLLAIYHYEDGSWQLPAGEVVDTSDHTITVPADSFSPFVLSEVPEPGTLALLAAGTVGLAGWASRKRALA